MVLFAMTFPGQGSQYVGMLSSFFYKNNNIFKNTFDEASQYAQYNLLQLIKNGPEQKLNKSKYTQLTILASSVAIFRLWREKNGKNPFIMSGHSLGEYSALVCSNSIKFSDALKMVSLRGELMEKETINRPSSMKAIIGLNKKKTQIACIKASKNNIVSLASINSRNQIVISGDKDAVYKASLNCKKYGAKKIFDLNVSVPAHSKLMKPVAKKLKHILNFIKINSPIVPVINNVDVKIEKSEKNIKNALIRQLYNTVRWKEIVDKIIKKKFLLC